MYDRSSRRRRDAEKDSKAAIPPPLPPGEGRGEGIQISRATRCGAAMSRLPPNPAKNSSPQCRQLSGRSGSIPRCDSGLMKSRTLHWIGIAVLGMTVGTDCNAVERQCPDTILNSYECSRYLENELAREHPQLFSRQGSKLVISLTSGGMKTYVDVADEKNHGVGGKWFNLVRYFPQIGYGLIAVQFYEGGTYYLLDLGTGRDEDIIAEPVISPDRKRIAVANVDLESRYTPNVLSVFRLQRSGLITEFIAKPDDWGPGNLRWIGNEEISFVQYTLNPEFDPIRPDEFLLGTPRELKHRTDNKGRSKWHIE